MKSKKAISYFFSVFLLAVILYLTFHTILKYNDIDVIIKDIAGIELKYVFICVGLVISYFLLQGIYIKRNLRLLNKSISIVQGIFYSVVEFFFSGITPSSTGGQPIELYYMNKDGIPKKKALITLLINTIFFKLIIVVFGILIFIFKYKTIINLSPIFIIFYAIGVIVDLFIVVGGYLLLYKRSLLKNILQIVENVIKKFIKHYDMKIEENLNEYGNEVKTLSKHKLEIFFEFLITLIQRLCLFSISFIVYKAFHLSEYNFIRLIIIQISVQTAIEFVPLPGGSGVSEYLFSTFFITAFGESLAATAMIVTRTFTFYIPLVVCGVILLCSYIKDNFICKEEQ